jgi:hypothetical protein
MKTTWNYRVVRTNTISGRIYYAVHEVYYDANGNPDSLTIDPVAPYAEDREQMERLWIDYQKAFEKPVLVVDDKVPGFTGEEPPIVQVTP